MPEINKSNQEVPPQRLELAFENFQIVEENAIKITVPQFWLEKFLFQKEAVKSQVVETMHNHDQAIAVTQEEYRTKVPGPLSKLLPSDTSAVIDHETLELINLVEQLRETAEPDLQDHLVSLRRDSFDFYLKKFSMMWQIETKALLRMSCLNAVADKLIELENNYGDDIPDQIIEEIRQKGERLSSGKIIIVADQDNRIIEILPREEFPQTKLEQELAELDQLAASLNIALNDLNFVNHNGEEKISLNVEKGVAEKIRLHTQQEVEKRFDTPDSEEETGFLENLRRESEQVIVNHTVVYLLSHNIMSFYKKYSQEEQLKLIRLLREGAITLVEKP